MSDGMPETETQVRRDIGSRAEARDFGSVDWATHAGSPAGAEMTVGLAVFDAGKGNEEHAHPNCEEVVYVLAGEVEHTLGTQSTVLRAGDLVVVPRNVAHRLINRTGDPVRACIVFSSPDRQFVPTLPAER